MKDPAATILGASMTIQEVLSAALRTIVVLQHAAARGKAQQSQLGFALKGIGCGDFAIDLGGLALLSRASNGGTEGCCTGCKAAHGSATAFADIKFDADAVVENLGQFYTTDEGTIGQIFSWC